jgi:hypothetical protein
VDAEGEPVVRTSLKEPPCHDAGGHLWGEPQVRSASADGAHTETACTRCRCKRVTMPAVIDLAPVTFYRAADPEWTEAGDD